MNESVDRKLLYPPEVTALAGAREDALAELKYRLAAEQDLLLAQARIRELRKKLAIAEEKRAEFYNAKKTLQKQLNDLKSSPRETATDKQ